jgi:electron transfer flavoprotein beta subunit
MTTSPPTVAVALKWVDLRPSIDPLTGEVRADPTSFGVSPADEAALEWALRLRERWRAELLALSAGPAAAEGALRLALAAGATRAVRVELDPSAPSDAVAGALAEVLCAERALQAVMCGDASLDRGSGSVPAFLAAELGVAQALGLATLEVRDAFALDAERRLDGGRRERLSVEAPFVCSVEAGTARLRRASLPGVLAARRAAIPVHRPLGPASRAGLPPPVLGPFRPRARAVPGPAPGLPLRQRVLALLGTPGKPPPRTVVADPAAAAEALLEALGAWGELP